ncbi:MAG TPA: serine/threonine-protein kinase [Ktedonobacterales bacterium]|jgi:serine/threonine-protein kinase
MSGNYSLEGRTLGRYRLLKGIGQGGMAQVYLAQDERLDRQVAIKILPMALAKEGNFLARFEREARSAAKLQHPNILPVHDYGQQDGITYLIMPFISGGTLAQRISQARGPLPLNKVVLWTGEMASALQFAHSQGIIHRDVKPGNMLIADGEHIVLSDFGIAKVVDDAANLTMVGSTVGSPDYMSPEQANGDPDYRSDIYSLGVVVFQMLTGRVPFTAGTPVQVMLMHVQAKPPLPRSFNPSLPPQVDAVIQKALAKRPAERYQAANELAEALRDALQGVIGTPPPTRPQEPDLSTRAEPLPTPFAGPQQRYTRGAPPSPAPVPVKPALPPVAPTNRPAPQPQQPPPVRVTSRPYGPTPAQPQPQPQWNAPRPAQQAYPGAYPQRPPVVASPQQLPGPAPRRPRRGLRVLLLLLAVLLFVALLLGGLALFVFTHPGTQIFGLS